MNIFATSSDPKQSAIWLDDKRLNKMITESAQIVCTVLSGDGVTGLPFKPTHHHHPIVKWAGETDSNLWWLTQHHYALHGEWTYRFDKIHASGLALEHTDGVYQAKPPKSFQNSAKNDSLALDFTWCTDVHLAYRMYLHARWLNDIRKPKWTKREEPDWSLHCGESGYFDLCRRAHKLVMTKPKQEIPCPRCGESLNYQIKGKLASLSCPSPDCILWLPI